MKFADTHIHLYASEFDNDRETLIHQAIAKGVSRFLLPNIDSSSVEIMLKLQSQFPENCFPMMGLHPCSVKENYEDELEMVQRFLFQKKEHSFCAVGEIGIDHYWDKTFAVQQEIAFRKQTEWAIALELPIVVHSRNSFHIILNILKEIKESAGETLRGVFHCFSGSREDAAEAEKLGFYLGIGGVVTYKKSGLDEVLKDIPLERILLETDAPYLAPVPFRGKRNEPSYILETAKKIAEIKQTDISEIAEITSNNSMKLFNR